MKTRKNQRKLGGIAGNHAKIRYNNLKRIFRALNSDEFVDFLKNKRTLSDYSIYLEDYDKRYLRSIKEDETKESILGNTNNLLTIYKNKIEEYISERSKHLLNGNSRFIIGWVITKVHILI
jgi:transcription initiation factor IIE alpha subunit